MMRIGLAADHDGFVLKVQLTAALKAVGYEVENLAVKARFH
jgi:ribose 5-phosphate isomerase RpiB